MIDPSIANMDPLPKRIRRPRGDTGSSHSSIGNERILNSTPNPAQVMVEENIQARTKIIRKGATLDTKDGCAGEFYECKSALFRRLWSDNEVPI